MVRTSIAACVAPRATVEVYEVYEYVVRVALSFGLKRFLVEKGPWPERVRLLLSFTLVLKMCFQIYLGSWDSSSGTTFFFLQRQVAYYKCTALQVRSSEKGHGAPPKKNTPRGTTRDRNNSTNILGSCFRFRFRFFFSFQVLILPDFYIIQKWSIFLSEIIVGRANTATALK